MTDLVVVSLEAWDEVWRRNQHLVTGLLRRDPSLRVLFVEPATDSVHDLLRRRTPRRALGLRAGPRVEGVDDGRLWLFQPAKWLPRRLDARVDQRVAAAVVRATSRCGLGQPCLWINDPDGAAVLQATGWPALYDITDDWTLASRSAAQIDRHVRAEVVLLERCHEVVVCSAALARTKGVNRSVTLIPNAVDVDAYRVPRARPVDLPPGPVALYVGTVHRDRIDLDLCVATAAALAGTGHLVLVGPAPLAASDREGLDRAGVVLLGARPAVEIPAYLQHADVLVVPHVVTPFTDSLDPIKLYEYRAVGRPVVSTPVAGFRGHPDSRITTAEGSRFVAAVHAAIPTQTPFPAGADSADVPRWADRVEQMAEVIARLEDR